MAGVSRWSSRAAKESGGVGAKLWPEMLALCSGEGVVNLGQGYPDHPGHKFALDAAHRALDNPKVNQYSGIGGLPELNNAVADYYQHVYKGDRLDPMKEVCILTSATEGLLASTMGLVNEGDEVVIFEPFFPWYLPSVRMAGGVPKVVELKPPSFEILEEDLERVFSPKTKMVLINSPHNPTGHCLSRRELELVAKYCLKHDVICVSDEVYEAQVFRGTDHVRIADLDGMRDRTVTISGSSKMLSLTGWRIGWAYGPEDLVAAIRTVHSFATYCAPAPFQKAVAETLQDCIQTGYDFSDIADLYKGNWELLASALTKMGATVCPAQGGYFLIADIAYSGMSDIEFVRWFAREKKVGAVPLGMFFSPAPDGGLTYRTLVRFAICKERSYIEKACQHILSA
eukprot:TRINITY_DN6476_c0_g1_i2.p1 TRINITY_DN6476_c0_g1~~TRINITY_DN6476_c0_g1_i2.p1  ORF type:complete len:399 (+),score=106.34 TRINITY_DN6476_c0_g1_i2:64-1260(+)